MRYNLRKYRIIIVVFVLGTLLCCHSVLLNDIPDSVTVPILLYHEINESGEGESAVDKDAFLEQLDAIQNAGYQTITFEQMIDYVEEGEKLPENPIVITFDDGYLSNYEIAWPALMERNMKATIFVIGCSVGKSTYKGTDVPIIPHFSYEQGREMVNSGAISLQSHTYDMHQFRPLEENGGREGVLQNEEESDLEYYNALYTDFQRAITELQKNTAERVQVLAYPFGLYSQECEELASKLGIKVTLTTKMEPATLVYKETKSLRLLGRYSIDDCSPEQLLTLIAEQPKPENAY